MQRSDAAFTSKIKGAPPHQIEALERLIGIRLPDSYRLFLEHFGVNDGDVFEADRARSNLKEIIEYIEEDIAEGLKVDYTKVLPFAYGLEFEEFGLVMKGDKEPEVHLLEDYQPVCFIAASLPKMLLQNSFVKLCTTYPYQFHCNLPAATYALNDLIEQAGKFGFEPEWQCDQLHYQAVKGDTLLCIRISEDYRIPNVSIASNDEESARYVAQHFEQVFGVKNNS